MGVASGMIATKSPVLLTILLYIYGHVFVKKFKDQLFSIKFNFRQLLNKDKVVLHAVD